MPFSFPQCKPCWKNKTPLCLEVRLKYLFGCLQLLSAFKNWRLIEYRYWWAKKWVGHKTGPVANQAQMEHGVQKGCAYSCKSATQCQDSQSQNDFRWWGTSWVMFSSTYYSGWKQFGFVDLCSDEHLLHSTLKYSVGSPRQQCCGFASHRLCLASLPYWCEHPGTMLLISWCSKT